MNPYFSNRLSKTDYISTRKRSQISTKLQRYKKRILLIKDNLFLFHKFLEKGNIFKVLKEQQSFFLIKQSINQEFLDFFKKSPAYCEVEFKFLYLIENQNVFISDNLDLSNDLKNNGIEHGDNYNNVQCILNIDSLFYMFLKSQIKDSKITLDSKAFFEFFKYKEGQNKEEL